MEVHVAPCTQVQQATSSCGTPDCGCASSTPSTPGTPSTPSTPSTPAMPVQSRKMLVTCKEEDDHMFGLN
jgi:hypothetical protein